MLGDLRPRTNADGFRAAARRGRRKWRRRLEGREEEARVWAASRGSCRGARSRWRGPPAAVRHAALAFRRGAAVTKDGVGPAGQREERGGGAGPCWLLRARGGRRLGRPVWLAWLPPARFLFFF